MGILGQVFHRWTSKVWQAEQKLRARLGVAPDLVAVQWLVTNACDLECAHCYSRSGQRLKNELSLDQAKTYLLDQIVQLGAPQVVLAGGEPLMRPDFPAIIRELKVRQIPWAIHTNGRLVPRYLASFQEHPPLMVAVSLDGPERIHDQLRGRCGAFQDAMTAIRQLVDIGVDVVTAGTTVHRDNADFLHEMLPLVQASGATSWGLHLLTPEGRAQSMLDRVADPIQIRRVAAFAYASRPFIKVELDNEWGSAGGMDHLYRDFAFVCGAGRFSVVVTPHGHVVPCTTTDLTESEGNVLDEPLSDIWRNGFKKFRVPEASSECVADDCWLQTRHGHSCRQDAFGRWHHEAALRAVVGAAE